MSDTQTFRQVGDASTGWSVPLPDGVHRRTLVKGAAWTIPVVATAIGAPLAAASTTALSLAFTQSSYSGTGCGTLTGVTVAATTDGAPTPGQVVAVTLPGGYSFADGSTTYSGTTDANGEVTLPTITLPADGGSANLTASSGAAVATAPVTVSPAISEADVYLETTPSGAYSHPAGTEAVGGIYYLRPNGDFYRGNTLLTTGVTSADSVYAGMNYASVVKSDGTTVVFQEATNSATYTQVPGTIAIGGIYYLRPNGDFYRGNTLLTTGVTSADSVYAGNNYASVVKAGACA